MAQRKKFERMRCFPKVDIPPEKRAERDLQMVANYFEVWKELVAEEFGREAADKLARKFGAKQGEISGKIYKKEMERRGFSPTNLEELFKIISISAELMGEDYHYWMYGPKKVIARTANCATLREQYDRSGTLLEHPPYDYQECIDRCDGWMDCVKWASPKIQWKRTKNVVDDGICEWEVWVED